MKLINNIVFLSQELHVFKSYSNSKRMKHKNQKNNEVVNYWMEKT